MQRWVWELTQEMRQCRKTNLEGTPGTWGMEESRCGVGMGAERGREA